MSKRIIDRSLDELEDQVLPDRTVGQNGQTAVKLKRSEKGSASLLLKIFLTKSF